MREGTGGLGGLIERGGRVIKFNSQICTTREQSERLIALGLKKETADMCYIWELETGAFTLCPEGWSGDIPAWSLHRLIELLFTSMFPYRVIDNDFPLYDCLIARIEWQIEEGYFDKQYLN